MNPFERENVVGDSGADGVDLDVELGRSVTIGGGIPFGLETRMAGGRGDGDLLALSLLALGDADRGGNSSVSEADDDGGGAPCPLARNIEVGLPSCVGVGELGGTAWGSDALRCSSNPPTPPSEETFDVELVVPR